MRRTGSNERKKQGEGLRQLFKYRELIICSNVCISVGSQQERRLTESILELRALCCHLVHPAMEGLWHLQAVQPPLGALAAGGTWSCLMLLLLQRLHHSRFGHATLPSVFHSLLFA